MMAMPVASINDNGDASIQHQQQQCFTQHKTTMATPPKKAKTKNCFSKKVVLAKAAMVLAKKVALAKKGNSRATMAMPESTTMAMPVSATMAMPAKTMMAMPPKTAKTKKVLAKKGY